MGHLLNPLGFRIGRNNLYWSYTFSFFYNKKLYKSFNFLKLYVEWILTRVFDIVHYQMFLKTSDYLKLKYQFFGQGNQTFYIDISARYFLRYFYIYPFLKKRGNCGFRWPFKKNYNVFVKSINGYKLFYSRNLVLLIYFWYIKYLNFILNKNIIKCKRLKFNWERIFRHCSFDRKKQLLLNWQIFLDFARKREFQYYEIYKCFEKKNSVFLDSDGLNFKAKYKRKFLKKSIFFEINKYFQFFKEKLIKFFLKIAVLKLKLLQRFFCTSYVYFMGTTIFKFFRNILNTFNINNLRVRFLPMQRMFVDAYVIADYIAYSLKAGFTIKKVIRWVKENLKRVNYIGGFKFCLSGRFSKKKRATYICVRERNKILGLTSSNNFVDYCAFEFLQKFGMCAVKVWIQFKKRIYKQEKRKFNFVCKGDKNIYNNNETFYISNFIP